MSCYCSNTSFTCNKSSFSAPLSGHCALSSVTPPIPAHYFNLFCPTLCHPIVVGPSAQHGIACNNYNGYNMPLYLRTPGHMPTCPTCPPTTSCGC